MSDASDGRSSDKPQPLVGFRTNAEWDELLERVDAMIAAAEHIADPAVRQQVQELLQAIDGLHREALTRLVRLFKEGVLEKVVTDPPIRTLLELYDLAPSSGAGAPDFITGYPPPTFARPATSADTSIEAPGPIPHWVPVLAALDSLAPGAATVVTVDDRELLIARVGGDVFAAAGRCVRDGSLLTGGTLARTIYACPAHAGCYYDLRQGNRIGSSDRLECHAVRVDDHGRVLVGIGVPYTPRLPAV
jgi:nitrite reductase/ring-hydroxylating ferredoxin subunit